MAPSYYLCLSHDVDRVYKTYQGFYYGIKSLVKGNFGNTNYHFRSYFGEPPYWNFEKIMEIEKSLGVKSTFFFLNETIPFNPLKYSSWMLSMGRYSWDDAKVRDIIIELDKNGWEIALHGSYHSYNNASLLRAEKKKLEQILGHKVSGVRQHYLNMSEETWVIQRELGFNYDSTLGYTRDVGFPNNKFHPFKPINDKFLVFPLVIMDNCLMSKKKPREEYIKILDLAEEKNGFVTINWHQRVFNEKEFPEYIKIYKEIIYEAQKRDAWVGSIQDSLKYFCD